MKRFLTLLMLPALLTVSETAAQARPDAEARSGLATRARQHAMDRFDARMTRLDALMGAPVRVARAAEAGRWLSAPARPLPR